MTHRLSAVVEAIGFEPISFEKILSMYCLLYDAPIFFKDSDIDCYVANNIDRRNVDCYIYNFLCGDKLKFGVSHPYI